MKLRPVSPLALVGVLIVAITVKSEACTLILVGRKASSDGSVIITYSADGPSMPRLLRVQGGNHPEGTKARIEGWEDKQVLGEIRQAKLIYSVVALMNEHQLSMGETTTHGRPELEDPDGKLDYDALIFLTLQRAKTAREAIKVIDELVRDCGYRSTGEAISIADKQEAWIMELIGKGRGNKGAVWVAARVPDDQITVFANQSRITTFPLDDRANWLYSPDVIDFAVAKGYYDKASGHPFSFKAAYFPEDDMYTRRACGGRVWSVYRRATPSRNFSDAYFRGNPQADDYPLFIKPDKPLALSDVMGLMRDHYEGTPYDMTKGPDAGPHGTPYRFRPLKWTVDGKTYMWERPISTQQAGFVLVTQSRHWLPDPIGGVTWFAPDDAYTSYFTPLYCGMTSLPPSYTRGEHSEFSWDSAWWVSNMVSNLTYDRWSRIIPDVQKAQRELEGNLLESQLAIEETAVKLANNRESLATMLLTNYSVSTAEGGVRRWQQLAEFILAKHNDGYVNTGDGAPQEVGYPTEWLRKVIAENPNRFELKTGKDH